MTTAVNSSKLLKPTTTTTTMDNCHDEASNQATVNVILVSQTSRRKDEWTSAPVFDRHTLQAAGHEERRREQTHGCVWDSDVTRKAA